MVNVRKAVITAASPAQRSLPLQTLVDHDGLEKTVLAMLVEKALAAGLDSVAVVICPGDERRYEQALGAHGRAVEFLVQDRPLGYGYALHMAHNFAAGSPVLHLVADHLYVNAGHTAITSQILQLAQSEGCSVSAVQPTRESLIGRLGAVAGRRIAGREGLYRIDTVLEKPTPTEAEQRLLVTGMRAAHYLCFFGVHVLTPAVFDILARLHAEQPERTLSLSEALAELATRDQYLAFEVQGRRYDIGARYGLLYAQVALALSGPERTEVLSGIIELLADAGPAGPGSHT